MNEILDSILDIDRRTKELREQTEAILESERENNRRVISELTKQMNQAMKEDAEIAVKEIQKSTEEELSSLRAQSRETIDRLHRYFEEKKGDLCRQLLKEMGV